MKNSNYRILAGLGVLTIAATLVSFSADKGKKKYEIIHHSKGKVVTYDTIIPSNSSYTVEAFLADKGIQSEHVEIMKVPAEGTKMMFIEKDEKRGKNEQSVTDESIEITVDIDDEGNKTIVKKVNGEVVELTPEELEEIENNATGGQVHIIEIEDGDHFEFTEELPEGAETVEIRAEIDENGNLVAHKFVNGVEVELTDEELNNLEHPESGGNHVIEFIDEEGGEEHTIVISKTISIEESDNGKEVKRTESHDVEWNTDDMNEEFTLVLIHENYDEAALKGKKSIVRSSSTSDFSLYPNPNNGQFTLTLEQKEKAKTAITITDVQGKVVFKEDLGKFAGKYVKEIDLKKFGAGTYLINVEQGNEKNVQKVIVQE